jgi:transcriptional regulator with XRE-family HTH domain
LLPERQIKYLYEELGASIKKLRKERKFKQAPFAELLKISRASLVNIELGRQHPPLHNLYEIARLLGVSVKDLLPDLVENNLEEPIDQKFEKLIEETSKGDSIMQEKLLEFVRLQLSTKTK